MNVQGDFTAGIQGLGSNIIAQYLRETGKFRGTSLAQNTAPWQSGKLIAFTILQNYTLPRMTYRAFLGFQLIIIILGQPLCAQSVTSVNWYTPAWENLTQEDGKGAFTEIVKRAFELGNAKVAVKFVPWARAVLTLETGEADMTGGMDQTDRFPLTESTCISTAKK